MGMTPPTRKAPSVNDLQGWIVDYVTDPRSAGFGRPLEDVAAELSSPGQRFTAEEIRVWMGLAPRPGRDEDPLAGELDEEKREIAMEERWREAAEVVPGAAEIIGVDRFRGETVDAVAEFSVGGPAPELAEVVGRMLDFLVPEISAERWVVVDRRICVPVGSRFEVWVCGDRVRGEPNVLRSTLVMWDAEGALQRLFRWTRPKGRLVERKGALELPVRQARLACKADLRAVAQRLVQVALEFRPGRHERLSQKELAELCDRTKQAISHQRGVIAKNVLAATGGRAGCRGRRNLRGKGGGR